MIICTLDTNRVAPVAITSELRGRWQENRRPSKKDVNSVRWEQLKNMLQSGKHKVQSTSFLILARNYNLEQLIEEGLVL